MNNNGEVKLIKEIIDKVLSSLDSDKAQEVAVFDVSGKTSIADYIVIASGRSKRHVASMAEHLTRMLKQLDLQQSVKIEGLPNADWVLIDVGDIIVHLFRPEVRQFYDLDRLWQDMIDSE